jgi:hypothetical protein
MNAIDMDMQDTIPGIPLCESPFFDEIFSSSEMDEQTIAIARELNEKGFAIIDFPDDDFDARVERIRKSLQNKYNWDDWKAGKQSSLRIQDAWKSNKDVKEIASNTKILELLDKLYGRRAIPFQTLNFPVGTQQATHSDSAHFSSFPERFMCGVWVAMEDIDETNGPLHYYPGSHKWPILTNEQLDISSYHQVMEYGHYGRYIDAWAALIKKQKMEPFSFHAKKGQALIWAANLLHGGSPLLDKNRTRWSQVTHYFFENCAYYTPLLSDPFIGRIHFRDLVDIVTGEKLNHQVGGFPVDKAFVKSAISSIGKPPTDKIYYDNGLPRDFIPKRYLELHPDVKAAGVDPRQHFVMFGKAEGRRWK